MAIEGIKSHSLGRALARPGFLGVIALVACSATAQADEHVDMFDILRPCLDVRADHAAYVAPFEADGWVAAAEADLDRLMRMAGEVVWAASAVPGAFETAEDMDAFLQRAWGFDFWGDHVSLTFLVRNDEIVFIETRTTEHGEGRVNCTLMADGEDIAHAAEMLIVPDQTETLLWGGPSARHATTGPEVVPPRPAIGAGLSAQVVIYPFVTDPAPLSHAALTSGLRIADWEDVE